MLCSPSEHTHWSFIFTQIGLSWLDLRSILFWFQGTYSEHRRLFKYFTILLGLLQTNTVLVPGVPLRVRHTLYSLSPTELFFYWVYNIRVPLRYTFYSVSIQQPFYFLKPSAGHPCPSVRLCISLNRHHRHRRSSIWIKNLMRDLQSNFLTEYQCKCMMPL